jgi:hypothetical protein
VVGRDGIAGLVCLAASLWLLALSRGLPQPALVPIGPGFYPRIVFGALAVLSALLVAADLLARRRPRGRAPVARGEPRNYRLVGLTFALFAAYVVAMPLLGYRLSTLLFLLALQPALDPAWKRHGLRIAIVGVAGALVTHLVFEGYLSVLLPRGRWTGF